MNYYVSLSSGRDILVSSEDAGRISGSMKAQDSNPISVMPIGASHPVIIASSEVAAIYEATT